MMHVPQAQKPSDKVSSRQLRRRTRKIQAAGSATSKGQMDIHMIRHLRKKSKEERKALMKKVLGHELVLEVPEGESLTMMGDLGLSWFSLNKLRRLDILVLIN